MTKDRQAKFQFQGALARALIHALQAADAVRALDGRRRVDRQSHRTGFGADGARLAGLNLTLEVEGTERAFLSTATGYGTVGVWDGEPFLDVRAGTIDCRRIEYEPRG